MYIKYSIDMDRKKEEINAEVDFMDDEKEFIYYSNFSEKYLKIFEGFEFKNDLYYTVCDVLSVDFISMSNDLFNLYEEFEHYHGGDRKKYVDTYIDLCESILDTLSSYHELFIDELFSEDIYNEITRLKNDDYKKSISYMSCEGGGYLTTHHADIMGIESEDRSDISSFFCIGKLYKFLLYKKYLSEIVNGNSMLADPQIFMKFANDIIETIIPNEPVEERLTEIDEIFESFLLKLNTQKQEYVYHSLGIFEFININLYNIFSSNLTIKKCNICGNFFVPYNRSDTLYCDRISPQDKMKTCKEYGAVKSYQNNLKTNKCMGLYRKIYMQKQMLAKRNPDIETYKNDFEDFKIQSKQWKDDVKKSIRTDAEFLAWLKSIRRKDDD